LSALFDVRGGGRGPDQSGLAFALSARVIESSGSAPDLKSNAHLPDAGIDLERFQGARRFPSWLPVGQWNIIRSL